jgi:hypothetical protein
MDATLLFPSEYVRAADLVGKDVTKTIATVKVDELRRVDGTKGKKPVLYFKDTDKKLVLNKTNLKTIIALHGKETNNWPGKRVTLFPTTCESFGEIVDCVRIRNNVNGNGNGKHKAAPEAESYDPVTGEIPDSVQPAQPPDDEPTPSDRDPGAEG